MRYYNTGKIQEIIEAAKKEIDAVVDKYQGEFEKEIMKQVPPNEYICSGMGSSHRCSLNNIDSNIDDNDFINLIDSATYGDALNTGFYLPYKFTSERAITGEIDRKVDSFCKDNNVTYKDNKRYFVELGFLKSGEIKL